jgi:glyoxylase I family protein
MPETGAIHHVILTVNDLARSKAFYAALMPRLGYPDVYDLGGFLGWSCKRGRFRPCNAGGGSFWLKQADPIHTNESFSKDRVGLCELAFNAENRAQVDSLAHDIESFGGRILNLPREYPEYVKGYYAVYFTDPDGIKLELAHLPRANVSSRSHTR